MVAVNLPQFANGPCAVHDPAGIPRITYPRLMAMIAVCPSCATRYTPPGGRAVGDTWIGRCSACGYSWLEANAIEIADARFETPSAGRFALPMVIDHGPDIDAEARRLAEAAGLAAARHQERRRAQRAALRGWTVLALAVAVPLAGAIAFPEYVIRAAPAAARIYSLAGVEVNVAGFVIRDAASEYQFVSGTPLLTVRGEIVNVASWPQNAPTLRFVLRDALGGEAYSWTLNGVGARQVGPGQATSFLTRVDAPPGHLQEVEIRFAGSD